MIPQDFRDEAVSFLAAETGLDRSRVDALLTVPPRMEMGDYAFPCHAVAKLRKAAPAAVAVELAAASLGRLRLLAGAEAAGGYLNLRVDRVLFTRAVLEAAVGAGTRYGDSTVGAGRTVVIDYSAPNIAKPFHVGHLRSTIIGAALYRIYAKLGYHVVGVNHLGDWGVQFGTLIVGLRRWGRPDDIHDLDALNRHYVRYHKEEEIDPTIREEAREWFRRQEAGDPEAIGLWRQIRETSLEYFQATYARIGVHFDSFDGEAFYNDKMEPVIQEAVEKGVATESEGALIIDLATEGIETPALLRKTDGATLYITRDLAAALYRRKTYDFHAMLYVVGSDQHLHFEQLFACLRRLGYTWAADCRHVSFGRVLGLSTRKGTAVYLAEYLDEARERVRAYMEAHPENRPVEVDVDAVAEELGKAAIYFADLSRQRVKDVQFDWDRACSFDGDTGPYLVNAHARIAGIIRKSGVDLDPGAEVSVLAEPEAQALVRLISKYPDALRAAAAANEPSELATYLLEVAHALHAGYNVLRVKDAPADVAPARRLLFEAVRVVLAGGLGLLGITPLERM
jgi:arginyl-tRNA synthetase